MDELFITVIIAMLTGNVVQFVVGVAMSRDLITIRDKRREAQAAVGDLRVRLGAAQELIRERGDNIASQTREITVRDGQIAKLTMELQEKTRELLKFINLNQSNLEIKENLAAQIRGLSSDLQCQVEEVIRIEEIIGKVGSLVSRGRPPHANDGRTAGVTPASPACSRVAGQMVGPVRTLSDTLAALHSSAINFTIQRRSIANGGSRIFCILEEGDRDKERSKAFTAEEFYCDEGSDWFHARAVECFPNSSYARSQGK